VELLDGDIVCVTSKVVSKAEGRVRPGDRDQALAGETRRLVARRGPLSIVVNRLGLTMAAAGIDASNVEPGHVVLLPKDPDASARSLRTAVLERTGINVAVLVTDTAGRAWREGQTDIAIGAAGLRVVDDLSGRTDPYGNVLAVTAPAVADELAGVAELAAGKLAGRPFAVVRGRGDLVLPAGRPGPGGSALIRAEGSDLFGLGAREAVLAALGGRADDRAAFGTAVEASELVEVLSGLTGRAAYDDAGEVVVPDLDERGRWLAEVASYALGWAAAAPGGEGATGVRVRRVTP
jgi:coenzyme F420-0:L-glutamate ligase/coenzyme F420-1:gamma-L-glutamate ligase